MKDKKTIKRDILDKFREIEAEDNDKLPPHWLEWEYLKELKAEEKKMFKKAMQELMTAGIVESVEGPSLNLRLTRKGENLISWAISANPAAIIFSRRFTPVAIQVACPRT